jgi:L-threonylcarbamoyladenylate synthase
MPDLEFPIPDSQDAIENAVALLENGGVVVGPTDTVYGILALADRREAVEKIRRLKHLPDHRPLLVLVPSCGWAQVLSDQPLTETRLLSLWPGPLTIVVKASHRVPRYVTGGGDTVAIRWPQKSFAEHVMSVLSRPLVAPSANISGEPTVRTADEAMQVFGKNVPLIVRGDDPLCGKPSTIVSIAEGRARILREGAIPKQSIAELSDLE